MAQEERRPGPEGPHHIILEEREGLTVSGVEEVESFDENTIVMDTVRGTLVVRGEGLHIEKTEPGRRRPEGGGHGGLPRLRGRPPGAGGPARPALPLRWRSPLPDSSPPWAARWFWGWPSGCSTTSFGCCGCACPSPSWGARWTCCSGCWSPQRSFSTPCGPRGAWCGCTWWRRCSAGRCSISGC